MRCFEGEHVLGQLLARTHATPTAVFVPVVQSSLRRGSARFKRRVSLSLLGVESR